MELTDIDVNFTIQNVLLNILIHYCFILKKKVAVKDLSELDSIRSLIFIDL